MQQLPFAIFPGFSATASLSLSSDGPIEPRLWSLAHSYDQAHAATEPRASARVLIVRPRLKPHAIRAVIAAILLKAAERDEAVTRADLKSHGLRDIDIDSEFGDAYRLAAFPRPTLFAPEAA